MVISNVCVDLILWIILYVMFRTVYVLDKIYIQLLYCQQWILDLSINTVQYNINSCHECYCFLWSSDVESLIILRSVECLLEQRQEKGKVREALVSNLGTKYLLFTHFHIYYSKKLYINSQTASCNIFETRDNFLQFEILYLCLVWNHSVWWYLHAEKHMILVASKSWR